MILAIVIVMILNMMMINNNNNLMFYWKNRLLQYHKELGYPMPQLSEFRPTVVSFESTFSA